MLFETFAYTQPPMATEHHIPTITSEHKYALIFHDATVDDRKISLENGSGTQFFNHAGQLVTVIHEHTSSPSLKNTYIDSTEIHEVMNVGKQHGGIQGYFYINRT